MIRSTRFAIALGVWTTLAIPAARAAASAPQRGSDPFAACRQQFADQPLDYESAYCFYQIALRQRLLDEGGRLFDVLIREHPDNFWLRLAGGHIYRQRDPVRTEALYRQAADGFQKQGDAGGEILARGTLRSYLLPRGRLQDATAEMARVTALAASVDDPLLKARGVDAAGVARPGDRRRSRPGVPVAQAERAGDFSARSVSPEAHLSELARVGGLSHGTGRGGARRSTNGSIGSPRRRTMRTNRPPPATTSSTRRR